VKPSEFLDRLKLSLQIINYEYTHIGNKWDTDIDIFSLGLEQP
jgi:hypothetical protein